MNITRQPGAGGVEKGHVICEGRGRMAGTGRGMFLALMLASSLLFLGCTQAHSQEASPPKSGYDSVRDFGAEGDGRSDDTEALQRAVDEGSGTLHFPPGIYKISRPIEVQLDKVGPISISADGNARLVMSGAGSALRLVGTHAGTAGPETVKPEIWERQRMPTIDGLEIVGDHPQASGIEAVGTMQLVITRVAVRSALHGIWLKKRNRNVIISESHLYHNRGVGLYLDQVNLHQINVTNSHISYNREGGIVVRNSEVRNLQIGSCDIEGNMAEDSASKANVLIDGTTQSVREGTIVGCTIQHFDEGPDSANVRLIGPSLEKARKVGHFVIADNAMSDAAVNVHLKYVRGVTLVGNTFWQAFRHNLLVEGSSNVLVGPNLFDRNPDYGPSNNSLVFRDSRDCTLNGLHVNNVRSAPAALLLQRCRWFNVTGCTILDSHGCGIALEEVYDSRVSDCTIRSDASDDKTLHSLCIRGGGRNLVADNILAGPVEVAPGTATLQGNRNP